MAGYLEFFNTALPNPVPLEPLLLVQTPPDQPGLFEPMKKAPDSGVETLLETYAGLAAVENGARVPRRNPTGWSSWYRYFTNLQRSDIQKNLRLAAGVLDNMIIESDDLELVDERGRNLLRRALALQGGRTRVRKLMDDGFFRIESRGGEAGDVLLLANLSDQEKACLSTTVPPRSAGLIPVPDRDRGDHSG